MQTLNKFLGYSLILWSSVFDLGTCDVHAQTLEPGSTIRFEDIPLTETPQLDSGQKRDRKKKRNKIIEMKRKFLNPPGEKEKKQKEAQRKIENRKPRPMKFYLQSSLAYTQIKTTGPRSKYDVEPTAIFHGIFRFSEGKNTKSQQFYYGFRLVSFNGSGVYDNSPGRFGFSYFGPMVGLGSFTNETDASPKEKSRSKDAVRSGYWLFAGVSALSRFGSVMDNDPVAEDFSNQGITYETPGAWTEIIYHWTISNSYAVSSTIGAHAGKEKLFYYLGFGVGGWH